MALVVKFVEAISIKTIWFLKSIIIESTLHVDRRDDTMVSGKIPKSLAPEIAKNKKCWFHMTVLNEMILDVSFLSNVLLIFHQSSGERQVGLYMTWVISYSLKLMGQ